MPEAHNGRAVETVRRAINAGGGLGEPWCLDAGAAVPAANGSPKDRVRIGASTTSTRLRPRAPRPGVTLTSPPG